MKSKIIKLVQDNTGEYLHDSGEGEDLLNGLHDTNIKGHTDKMNYIKIRFFCSSKDTSETVESQAPQDTSISGIYLRTSAQYIERDPTNQ